MLPTFDTVYIDEAFDGFLEAAWLSEDARHETDMGDADDSEGLTLSSNPPSPLTPLPSWFDSNLPNPDLEPAFLPPPLVESQEPQSPLTPSALSEEEALGADISALALDAGPAAPQHLSPPDESIERTAPPSIPDGGHEKKRRGAHRNKLKARKRREEAACRDGLEAGAYVPKASTVKKHADFGKSQAFYDAKDLSAAKGAWIGARLPRGRRKPHTIAELRRRQFKYIPWNGE